MSDPQGEYWPVFNTEETPHGEQQHIVHWHGRRWRLLTPIMDNWQLDQYPQGLYEQRGTKVELSFKMLLLDGESPT